jgi:acyl dehydratase
VTETTTVAWADVAEGFELVPLQIEVSATTLARGVLGTRDLYPMHHDPGFAKGNGARDMFLNTMWYQGTVGRYVTDWAGPGSFLRMLEIGMRAHCCPGDTLRIHGRVTGRREDAGGRLVDLSISVDNQLRAGAVTARATVEVG